MTSSFIVIALVDIQSAGYYHYKDEDIVLLTDDSTNPRALPTKANIIDAMKWLVCDAQPNDSLFFHCRSTFHIERFMQADRHWLLRSADSGHGGQVKDIDGDEVDGYDEGTHQWFA